MKKNFILSSGLFCALSLTALVSCSFEDINPAGEISAKESTNIQAATGLNIIANLSIKNAAPSLRQFSKDFNKELTDEEKNKIEQILPTVDMLLDNGNVFSSVREEIEITINDVTYSYKETISFINSNLSENNYFLFYNELDEKGEVIAPSLKNNIKDDHNDEDHDDADDNHDHDHDHDYEDEIVTFQRIAGLATFDEENFYDFESVSKSEIEDDESEEERWFKINLDENSYVRINQEIETEKRKFENEFSYIYVENNAVKSKYSIEIEKGRKDQIKVKIDDLKYSIDRLIDKNGEVIFKIKYKDDSSKILATYKKEVDEEGNITFVLV